MGVRAPSQPRVAGRLARQDGHRALTEFLLTARPGGGGLGGTASQTGLALQGLLAAMLAFSSPCVRRGGHFEVCTLRGETPKCSCMGMGMGMGTGLGSPCPVSLLTPAPCPQIFYWSHLSYVSVWALLVLHAPNFWKWFVVPGGLFVLEKAVGLVVSRAVGLRIVEVNLLPSKVRSPRATPGPSAAAGGDT